jgi:hypothetical protein
MKLEDIFAGYLELTASEVSYLHHALQELYMRGGWAPNGKDKRELAKSVSAKLNNMKLFRMVTPDGSRLVSVEEHKELYEDSHCDSDATLPPRSGREKSDT